MARSKVLRCTKGSGYGTVANEPVIAIVGTGKSAYLWIGNDAKNDGWCFAHVNGRKRLEKFARAILAELKPKHRKPVAKKRKR